MLKTVLHAPRPYVVDTSVIQYDTDTGWGLPSAHALMSVVILGLARCPPSKEPYFNVGIACDGYTDRPLSVCILGVHYPSQVLAGWVCWAGLLLYIFHIIDKRLWATIQKETGSKKAKTTWRRLSEPDGAERRGGARRLRADDASL